MGSVHYAFDHRAIDRVVNAQLSLGTVRKDQAGRLMGADKPWEGWYDNLYGNIVFDPEEGLYRLWHSLFLYHRYIPGGKLNEEGRNESGLCYATSKDGLHWEKPELGLVDFEGSRSNNLVMRKVHGVGLFKDEQETDPNRRYKAFFKDQAAIEHSGKRDYRMPAGVAYSPDGLYWTRDLTAVMPRWFGKWGDTHNNVFRDSVSGKYVLMTRTWTDPDQGADYLDLPKEQQTEPPTGRVRLLARMESVDFRIWSRPVDVLLEEPGEFGRRQLYTMPAFPWDGIYLGLLTIINTDEGDKTVDSELAWSPDTWRWYRICPGESMIPRGAPGEHDFGTVYAAHQPIQTEDGIRLYYGGAERPHQGYRACGLGLAYLRHDGWAAYAPRDRSAAAAVVTRPIKCDGNELWMSCDAADGAVRVSIDNQEGLTLDDCVPVSQDCTRRPVKWGGYDLRSLRGREITVRFELRNSRLFAFGFL